MERPRNRIGAWLAALVACALAFATFGATGAAAHHYDHLLAPTRECPHQTDRGLGIKKQEGIMRCMHRYARQRAGSGSIEKNYSLQQSSEEKSQDIIDCQEFAHDACGRSFTYWISKMGFSLIGCYGVAENISFGSGYKGNVRYTMSGWLHSDGHRHTLLSNSYERIGIGMVRGNYQGYRVQVWTSHWAYRC